MKYGLKAIFRFPIRTILFLILISAAALSLALGASIWGSSLDMLAASDKLYTTAGEVTYQGSDSDNSLANPSSNFDITALSSLPGVTFLEENIQHRAYIENYRKHNNDMPYSGFSIVVAEVTASLQNSDYFLGNILDVIYESGNKPRGAIYLSLAENDDFSYEIKNKYLIIGSDRDIYGQRYKSFRQMSYADLAVASGAPDVKYPSVINITDFSEADMEAFWKSDEGQYYIKLMEMMYVINNSVDIVASSKVEVVEAFHRGEYTLTSGDFFMEEDYISGDVCIIPYFIAEEFDITIGDSIDLNIHKIAGDYSIYASYWPEDGFASHGSYLVTGIYQTTDKNSPIYIPYSGQNWLNHSTSDNVYGRVIIKNNMAKTFISEAESLLPRGVTLSLYDQGFENVEHTISNMLESAALITVVSLTACFVILIFFAYLFVGRNEVSAGILLNLGTGGKRVWLFFVSGATFITFIASLIGTAIAYFLSGYLMNLIYKGAQLKRLDKRFSISGSAQLYELSPSVNIWPFILAMAFVICISIIICTIFARLIIRKHSASYRYKMQYKQSLRGKRTETNANSPHKIYGALWISKLPFKSLRYGIKTMLRGNYRAIVTTLAFAALLCSIGIMGSMKKGYENGLMQAYDEIPVTVHFTDIIGRKIDNLSIKQSSVRKLESFNFIQESWYSRNCRYHYAGVSSYADGRIPEEPNWVKVPDTGTFAYETFQEQLNKRFSPMVMCNNPTYTSGFFYSATPEIEWIEGYGWEEYNNYAGWESRGRYYEIAEDAVVMVHKSFLETNGLSLGDTIYVEYFFLSMYGEIIPLNLEMKIVGVLMDMESSNTLYAPASLIFSRPDYDYYETYNAAGARLKDTENLSVIKDALATDFSEVNSYTGSRIWIYIDDTSLNQSVENFKRHIDYIDYLYPVILTMSIGLGFLIANLLLRSRRREIALLRSVGGGKATVFASLFWEQILLCILGALIGIVGLFLITGQQEFEQGWKMGLFAFCYLLGAAAAIIQAQRTTPIKSLMEVE